MLQEQIINLNMQQYIILRNFTYDIEKEYLESDIFAMSSHSESLPFASLFLVSQRN